MLSDILPKKISLSIDKREPFSYNLRVITNNQRGVAMKTIGERLKFIRTNAKMTQKEMAEKIGLKQNSISVLEKNQRTIQQPTVELLKINFGINEKWLLKGIGEPYVDPLEDEEGDEHVKELTRKILTLPEDQQEKILKLIDLYLE